MRKFVAVGVAVLAFVGASAVAIFVIDFIIIDSSRSTQDLALWAIVLIVAVFAAGFAYRLVRRPARTALFNPGAGIMPPRLAGREQARALLSRCLSDLEQGAAPPSDVMLVGPRGNGKTVLLLWFADACRKAGVAVVDIAPSRVRTQQELCNALLPAGRLGRLLPARWSVAVAGRVEWEASHPEEQAFIDRLAARCRRKPRVVLVDEAHTLRGDVGQYLLNVSQDVRPKAPFLLVLAGTPGLPAHLRKMDASFWDRNRRLGIGRLSEVAAREALQEPLGDRGTSIHAQALDAVVKHSQRYAYFIQIWGEELWDKCLATKKTQLTTADVADVQDNVERRMTDYYSDRYRELEAGRLLWAARAVALAFQGDMDVTATDQTIDEALATLDMDEAERLEAREKLSELGYIWCPPGQKLPVVWSAGIPSLMQHVLEQATSAKDCDKSNTIAGHACGDG